jgi:hypothetical protein
MKKSGKELSRRCSILFADIWLDLPILEPWVRVWLCSLDTSVTGHFFTRSRYRHLPSHLTTLLATPSTSSFELRHCHTKWWPTSTSYCITSYSRITLTDPQNFAKKMKFSVAESRLRNVCQNGPQNR